jgi:hypothetical protein
MAIHFRGLSLYFRALVMRLRKISPTRAAPQRMVVAAWGADFNAPLPPRWGQRVQHLINDFVEVGLRKGQVDSPAPRIVQQGISECFHAFGGAGGGFQCSASRVIKEVPIVLEEEGGILVEPA